MDPKSSRQKMLTKLEREQGPLRRVVEDGAVTVKLECGHTFTRAKVRSRVVPRVVGKKKRCELCRRRADLAATDEAITRFEAHMKKMRSR